MVQGGSEELQAIHSKGSEEGAFRDLRVGNGAREERGVDEEREDDVVRREGDEQRGPDQSPKRTRRSRRQRGRAVRIRGRAAEHLSGPKRGPASEERDP